MTRIIGALLFLAILGLGAAAGEEPGTGTQSKPAAPPAEKGGAKTDFEWFRWTPPAEWKPVPIPHGNNSRKEQLSLPAPPPAAAADAGELIVHFFGKDQGGGVEANLERWKGQFEKAPDAKEEDFAQTSKQKVDGLDVTILEVRGAYTGSGMPGAPAGPKKPDWMLLAAIVETAGGNFYIKTVGPRATLEHWKKAWYQTILGIKSGKGA
ncbi:MAG: hypothetical protein L0Z55_01510 [Planctomycetes bacterium]|nr:hypothetical protein [Planctomycetota bacterium]